MPRSLRPDISVHSFNQSKFFNPVKNLHWNGFRSTDKIFSLDTLAEQLSLLHPSYKQSSLFERAISFYSDIPASKRLALQREYLAHINHDQYATIYPAFLKGNDIQLLRSQTEKIASSCLKFARDLVIHKGVPESFKKFIRDTYPQESQTYDTILATNLLNYSAHYEDKRWQDVARQLPLYAECGVDYMYADEKAIFAELQFSYQSYPHHLDILSSANAALLPELMQDIERPDFCTRRVDLINSYIRVIADHLSIDENDISRIVVDAWAMTKHPCRNYKILAHQLKGTYKTFDEFNHDAASYRNALKEDAPTFIFNQALLYLMDPRELFGSIIHEQLEHYPNLNVKELYDDYMDQRAFLANSPIVDLLNDKAMYALIPALYEYYQGEKFTGNISLPHPVWNKDEPLYADKDFVEAIKSDKNDHVICHRYLESGDGIRVGRNMTQEEWGTFIDSYVMEKPYLFISRNYINMKPDLSLRMYYSGMETRDQSYHETSDAILGRINPSGSLVDESHFFVCYPS